MESWNVVIMYLEGDLLSFTFILLSCAWWALKLEYSRPRILRNFLVLCLWFFYSSVFWSLFREFLWVRYRVYWMNYWHVVAPLIFSISFSFWYFWNFSFYLPPTFLSNSYFESYWTFQDLPCFPVVPFSYILVSLYWWNIFSYFSEDINRRVFFLLLFSSVPCIIFFLQIPVFLF